MRVVMRGALLVSLLVGSSFGSVPAAQDGRPLLDPEVEVVSFEGLTYPPIGRQARIEGTVVVRVTLDNDGQVMEAVALSGLPVFLPSCLENVRKWRFRSEPRKTTVIVYNFKILAGRCDPMNQTNLVRNVATVTSCQGATQVSNGH